MIIRNLIRLAVVLLVVLGIGVGALLWLLPGIVESPAVRERVAQAARDATGREFSYGDLDFGLLPPRLVMAQPRLAGEKADDPSFVEAREVSLRVAFWPLLAGAVVLDQLVVDEATVRLVRDDAGLRLPEPQPQADSEPGAGSDASEPSDPVAREEESAVALAVKAFSLRGSRILLEDRTVSPPARWDVQALELSASFELDAPVAFDLDAEIGGGDVHLDGQADLVAETTDVEARLDGVGLAVLGPYLPERRELAGTLSGTVRASGPFAAPGVKADLRVDDGVVRISDVGLRGPLTVAADLAGGETLSGSFRVDATDAELDAYEGTFRKPAGRPGSVQGRFVPRSGGGLRVDDVEVRIHNLDARGTVEMDTDDRVRAELTAPPLDLAGWDEILPALAEYKPSGTLSPGKLTLATEPLSVRGRVGLDGVRLVLPDGPEIGVEGALEGVGDALRLVGMQLTTGQERMSVEGEVSGLSRDRQSYQLSLDADGAESHTLLTAFTGVDRLYGPLFLDTRLAGRTGDPKLEALSGRMAFAVRPGRLKGVSLLEETVGRLGSFGEAALLVGALKQPERMRKMERFYGDEFQELAGTFDVAKGWARTPDLRLVYDDYRVDLHGGIRLHDLALDFSGTLTLDREVDETLADASGGQAAPESQRVIQLAKVTGTLDSPKVGLSSGTVRDLVGGYASRKVRDKYQDRVNEKLGEELGGEVGNLVDGLFGKKKSEP